MCCQPPNHDDDLAYYYGKNISTVNNAPKELREIGITGGEPTLLNERFFSLLQHINAVLPDTHIHVLSNGRRFYDLSYCQGFDAINKKQLLVGIPLHSDYSGDHDRITRIKGSHTQTIKGLYNLGRMNVPVELRIVINKLNYERLPQISSFIYRNLPFVRYVSFMGMETTGWAVKNRDAVWIDPWDYRAELEHAVLGLSACGIDTTVFNLPHCLLPVSLHPFATKSISDWKVNFSDNCSDCVYRQECCGLFVTSEISSRKIIYI
jgi:His-Xaa-Ser system radical SAM maturase HxsC